MFSLKLWWKYSRNEYCNSCYDLKEGNWIRSSGEFSSGKAFFHYMMLLQRNWTFPVKVQTESDKKQSLSEERMVSIRKEHERDWFLELFSFFFLERLLVVTWFKFVSWFITCVEVVRATRGIQTVGSRNIQFHGQSFISVFCAVRLGSNSKLCSSEM